MKKAVYPIDDLNGYAKAGPEDLIALHPPKGCHPLFLTKRQLELIGFTIFCQETAALSGPTGTAKSSSMLYLFQEPRNFKALCQAMKMEYKPLKVYPIEMVTFVEPSEIYYRRAINPEGGTYDENSPIVEALLAAQANKGKAYHVIWLRELGRCYSAAVQAALVDLIAKGETPVRNGKARVDCGAVAWITDSNYAAMDSHNRYVLVKLDSALARRFNVQIRFNYLPMERETEVLFRILEWEKGTKLDQSLIIRVVKMGNAIRELQQKGELLSVKPPTLGGYLTFLHMCQKLAHCEERHVAECTLVGNAQEEDANGVKNVLNKYFGLLQGDEEADDTVTAQVCAS
jgi:MoxR-like ATPase